MRRPAQLSSHLAARSPYWTLVLLLQYLHLALGRPAPPSEEEDAPAANDDGAGGVAVKEEQKPTATAAPSTAKNEAEKSSSTETATAAWATQTSGGMQQSSDKQDTIILHSDASLSYGCPESGDKWEQESLTDSLTAHTATGAGCWMRYTFQGDSVQVYGASGLQAGVFGCSVNSGSTNTTGWWNAYGSANFYRPYSGSCSIQGIGYDKHTIQLTNSPYQPKKVYFTGLRITTNQTQPIWETLKWEACCQKFTFPDGVATTVGASASTGTTNANGLLTGLDGSTFSFIIAAIAAVVIAAAALIAVMCCKPRKINPSVNLQHILSGDEKQPLRAHRRRHSRQRKPSPSPPSSATSSSSESTTDGGSSAVARNKKRSVVHDQ